MIASMLLAFSAHADVVGPDPEDCPRGAIGRSNHNGPYCTPQSCDAGCADGTSCESVGLCIIEEERNCGGMTDPNNPCTYTHVEATASCASEADCTTGTCVVADRCAADADRGCTHTGLSSAAWGLLALLPLLSRRR